jgi:pimeloyl-ACP methyl ester carboxylesterase
MTRERFQVEDGTYIAYRVAGKGPAIVLCAGIGCDDYAWRYLEPELLKHFTVIVWNYRGHGASSPPVDPDAIEMADHCRDLLALLDHLKIDQTILFGHSMGVQVILEFYGLAPDRIRALIPVCGSYGYPLDTFGGTRTFKDVVFPHLFRLLAARNSQFIGLWRKLFPTGISYRIACLLEINWRLIQREDFMPYLEHMSQMDPDLFGRMLKAASQHTAEPILPRINVPTLIFAGEQDGFTPASVSIEMHRMIRDAELCLVPGGSHTSPLEIPELYTLRLEKFLRTHELYKKPTARKRPRKRKQAS